MHTHTHKAKGKPTKTGDYFKNFSTYTILSVELYSMTSILSYEADIAGTWVKSLLNKWALKQGVNSVGRIVISGVGVFSWRHFLH